MTRRDRRPVGCIDQPAANAILHDGSLLVCGWAYDPAGPILGVEIRLGNKRLGLARFGLTRDDVAEALQDHAATASGFEFATDLMSDRPQGPAQIAAVAIRADRSTVTIGRVDVEVAEIVGAPFPTSFAVQLERPRPDTTLETGWLSVRGWAFAGDAHVSHVELWWDGRPLGRASLGRPRWDVAERLGSPQAVLSGFEFHGRIDADGSASEPLDAPLQAVVTWTDGRREASRPIWVRSVSPVSDPAGQALAPARRSQRPSDVNSGASGLMGQTRRRSTRLLIVARGLDHGGSQLRMAEFVEHLDRDGGFEITVLAPEDGPLRARLERAGATIEAAPAVRLDDRREYERAIDQLGERIAGRFDVVYAATVTGFPAIEAAAGLGLPTILRVGEAARLQEVVSWLYGDLDPGVAAHARRAFAAATVVISTSHLAISTYRGDGYSARFVVLPSGVQLGTGGQRQHSGERDQVRRRYRRQLGIDPAALLLVCAAKVWPIKGQSVLALALAHAGEAGIACALLGDAEPGYGEAIDAFTEATGLVDRISVLPFEPSLGEWWRAADVGVCCSETESMPAAVLEAMAAGLPVLACRVGDVERVVEPGVTGWLCEPNDVRSLAEALREVAQTPTTVRSSMGERAYQLMRSYDRETLLARAVELLRGIAGGELPSWVDEAQ